MKKLSNNQILGIGAAAAAGIFLLFKFRVKAATGDVIVKLRNYADATHYDIALLDWEMTGPIHRNVEEQYIPVKQGSGFLIPVEAWYPLRIMRLHTVKPSTTFPGSWMAVYEASGWNPDSQGLETYIEGPGTIYFNIATEQFEL